MSLNYFYLVRFPPQMFSRNHATPNNMLVIKLGKICFIIFVIGGKFVTLFSRHGSYISVSTKRRFYDHMVASSQRYGRFIDVEITLYRDTQIASFVGLI